MGGATRRAAEIADARHALHELRAEARQLASELERAQQQAAQAVALALEEGQVGARMEALERVLDLAAVTAHARASLAQAQVIEAPARLAIVQRLLPEDVYQAAIDAIPAPVFAGGERSAELSLPPKVAPTFVVATWMFLNDVAKDLIGPALAAHLAEPPAQPREQHLTLSRSRLVWRQPGESPLEGDSRPGEVLEMVVHLGRVYPNQAWAFRGGSVERAAAPLAAMPAPGSGWVDWHVGFGLAARPPRAGQRRHGDIDSWLPQPPAVR